VLISSDEDEVVQVCDRALVFVEGRVVASFDRESLTEQNVVIAAAGNGRESEPRRSV
jgi:ABC-type sugar transport system ATPase subunit